MITIQCNYSVQLSECLKGQVTGFKVCCFYQSMLGIKSFKFCDHTLYKCVGFHQNRIHILRQLEPCLIIVPLSKIFEFATTIFDETQHWRYP